MNTALCRIHITSHSHIHPRLPDSSRGFGDAHLTYQSVRCREVTLEHTVVKGSSNMGQKLSSPQQTSQKLQVWPNLTQVSSFRTESCRGRNVAYAAAGRATRRARVENRIVDATWKTGSEGFGGVISLPLNDCSLIEFQSSCHVVID